MDLVPEVRVLDQVCLPHGTEPFSAARWPFGVGFGADPACARRSSEAACQDPDQNALRTHERASGGEGVGGRGEEGKEGKEGEEGEEKREKRL